MSILTYVNIVVNHFRGRTMTLFLFFFTSLYHTFITYASIYLFSTIVRDVTTKPEQNRNPSCAMILSQKKNLTLSG